MKNFIDTLDFAGQDERIRKYLFPKRIVLTTGKVEHEELILEKKPLQIGLSEPSVTCLSNLGGEEQAGILLDYGCEIHGSLRLLCHSAEGTTYPQVRLCFGESVAEAMGHLNEKGATNDHSVRDMVVTLSSYSDMEFGLTGFRFVYIQLLGENARVTFKSAVAVFIYRELEYKGSFVCDDERLNKIYETSAYTCHVNMQNFLWDGIKRDRLVWIGDIHPEMLTIRTIFGQNKIIEESLDFTREQTPLPQWMNGIPTYSMWWMIILWDWYMYTGNEEFVNQQKQYVNGLVSQVCSLINDDGTDNLTDYFLDWPTHGTKAAVQGVRGLLVLGLESAIKLSDFYKNTDDIELCKSKIAALKKTTAEHHGSKAAAAFLALSNWTENSNNNCTENQNKYCKGNLNINSKFIAEGGAKGMSTFLSYYMLKVVAQGGQMNNALEMLRDYYGGMLKMGATTFWEDFNMDWLDNATPIDMPVPEGKSDIHGDNGAFCYIGFRHSLCHGWSSGPVPFLAEKVMGVEIVEAGCRKLQITPNLGDLKWVKGTFPTPLGVVSISHTKNNEGIVETKVEAPEGVEIFVA